MPPISPTVAALGGAAVGLLVGAAAATAISGSPSASYNTFRTTIKTQTKGIDDCKITPSSYPTHMYRIRLTNTPFTAESLTTQITEMDLSMNSSGGMTPGPATPYAGVAGWTPTTPLDLNLGLVMVPGGGKHARVLIQVIVDDPKVRMIADPFTIISNDSNKQMFCRYPGGATTANSVTFGVNYLPGMSGQKVFGSYSVGVMLPTAAGVPLPIYLDPEVQNEG
jgi:hypothetical protein